MSEIRRVPLLPLKAVPEKHGDVVKSATSCGGNRSCRIKVTLPEPNEDTCPEYNYKDELAAAKKRDKHNKGGNHDSTVNGFGPLDNDVDEDEVKRIARQMEEKYGTGVSLNRKRKKGRKDDYADIGMGYDETDSFIDNTDGYDEIIPQNVTTLHGGFYINSGALEFKADDDVSSVESSSSSSSESSSSSCDEDMETDTASKLPPVLKSDETKPTVITKNRKRRIQSISSSSTGDASASEDTDKTESDSKSKRSKLDVELHSKGPEITSTPKSAVTATSKVKRMLSTDQHASEKKKRKLLDNKKTVKDLLKARREHLVLDAQEQKTSKKDPRPNGALPKVRSNLSLIIEEVAKGSATSPGKPSKVSQPLPPPSDLDTTSANKRPLSPNNSNSSHSKSIHKKLPPTLETSTLLPPQNNDSVMAIIDEHKHEKSSHETVVKNTVSNNMQSSICSKKAIAVELPVNLSQGIVDILNNIKDDINLKRSQDPAVSSLDLLTHVKNQIIRLERKAKCLGKNSKSKIYEHLANVIECKPEFLLKTARHFILNNEKEYLDELLKKLKKEIAIVMPALIESYEKEVQQIVETNALLDKDNKTHVRMPKKSFKWNHNSRKLATDIILKHKRCLVLEDVPRHKMMTKMLDFLQRRMLVLWPEGWMSMNTLQKICENLCEPKTSTNNLSSATNSSSPLPPATTKVATTFIDTTCVNIISSACTTNSATVTTSSNVLQVPIKEEHDEITIVKEELTENDVPSSDICSDYNIGEPSNPTVNSIVSDQPYNLSSSHTVVDDNHMSSVIITKDKRKSPTVTISPIGSAHTSDNTSIPVSNFKRPSTTVSPKLLVDNITAVIDLSDKNDRKLLDSFHSPNLITSPSKSTTSAITTASKNSSTSSMSNTYSGSLSGTSTSKNTNSGSSLTITPSTSVPTSRNDEDILKVMEDLKAFQKLASSKKWLSSSNTTVTNTSPHKHVTSAAPSTLSALPNLPSGTTLLSTCERQLNPNLSVTAITKSNSMTHSTSNHVSHKPVVTNAPILPPPTMNLPKVPVSNFQEEFQKQLILSALGHPAAATKPNLLAGLDARFPQLPVTTLHNSATSPDKYYPYNTSSGFTNPNINGHRNHVNSSSKTSSSGGGSSSKQK